MMALNCAIWGFLSNAISGEAETFFKQANVNQGVDAWRRLVRHIDHGKDIRLHNLREEIRNIRLRPIKTLEGISVGVAQFDNKVQEFVDAGGRRPDSEELKFDLNALLPSSLMQMLALRANDPFQSYEHFRDFVLSQSALILMTSGRLPLQAVH